MWNSFEKAKSTIAYLTIFTLKARAAGKDVIPPFFLFTLFLPQNAESIPADLLHLAI